MLSVLLVAEEAAGLQALKLLDASAHEVVAVLSSSGEGFGRAVRDPRAVTDPAFAEELRNVDLLLNVHSLHVAAPEVVEAPRIGSFNLHPGPLPEYAGLNAPSWAIYDGRRQHAVTLHRMAAEVDAGPVAYWAELPIEPDDRGSALAPSACAPGCRSSSGCWTTPGRAGSLAASRTSLAAAGTEPRRLTAGACPGRCPPPEPWTWCGPPITRRSNPPGDTPPPASPDGPSSSSACRGRA